MKKRIVVLLTIVGLLGLAVAAYAYTSKTSPATTAAMSCCKKQGDSCPMKGKGHDDKGDHAKASCCKKHEGDHAKDAGHSCCDCCGDSCPMKKDGAAAATSDGKSCCDDCECCKDGKTV